MFAFAPWQRWAIWAVLLMGAVLALPNFFAETQVASWPKFAPRQQVNLGLDLRGGSHIMLEASPEEVARQRLQTLEEEVRGELRRGDDAQRIATGEMSLAGGRLSFPVSNPAQLDAAVERVRRITRPDGLSGQRDFDVSVIDGTRVVVTPTEAGERTALRSAMTQALEVIRRRIDELGTREPDIRVQGANRISVDVPGLKDPAALKALIGKTAKLEFKLVDTTVSPEDLAAGRAGPGSQVLPYAEGSRAGGAGARIAVNRRAIITGDQLVNARQTFGQDGLPVVEFRFDSTGARRFAKTTTDNVGRQFAIILDNQVISAPVIKSPIIGGSGVIEGNFTTQSANELAVLLRSGKLPVALTVVEERTVGPDLGRDSIHAGTLAAVVATIAVALFILVTYGRFGVYACIALVFNILLILGIMSVTGATLTLPGIAGLVLTIGAAVDANVLINERIREERRRGRGIVQAVETGYREASRTIFDANLTNVIAAAVMFILGSGPIKGFGVVLTIGIVTSVFTAVTFTRLLISGWLRKRPAELVL
ncbi:MAG: protein translocase subunit SecD [Sphingomonadaceae bacterium]|nr:protein translocase subunit SecD [Sphingomonadaceae bacterium]